MSPQADYVVANGTGAAVRSDINGQLAAIVSQNSGTTEPTTTYAYMRWADTTAGVMKMRNGANNAWITLYQLDGEWSTIAFENGSASAPSIYFKDSGTDTGIYSPGTDQVAISTAGTGRLFVNASGNVGLGTSSPSAALHVVTSGAGQIRYFDGTVTGAFGSFGSGNELFLGSGKALAFTTNGITSSETRMTIDTTGRVGIGVTAPQVPLDLISDASGYGIVLRGRSADGLGQLRFTSNNYGTIYSELISTSSALAVNVNGSERARIDSSGRLLVGTSSSSASTRAVFQGNSFSSGQPCQVYFQRDSSSSGLTAGAGINYLLFADNAGGVYSQIAAEVDGNAGTNDYPGRLVFSTTADSASSPTERMRIDSSGNLLVGATSGTKHTLKKAGASDFALEVANTSASTPYVQVLTFSAAAPNNTTSMFLRCDDTGLTGRIQLRSDGGIANFSANNVNLSDRNAKKDIASAIGTWDCLKEWEIVNFRYKDQPDDAELSMGVIAQQVAESCPEVITVFQEATEDQPEKLGVKDQQMMWMAIKALQEAQLRIETLEAEVAALKAQ